MSAIWQALFANVALIAILLLAWEILSDFTDRLGTVWRSLIFGAMMGLGAVASMVTAPEVLPGVIFDLRASLISAAGLFGGMPAAVVGVALALAYRVSIGGIGLLAGMTAIILAFGIGLYGHRLTAHRVLRYTDIVIFALVTPFASLAGYLMLPDDVWLTMIARTGIPIVILSFSATLLIASALYRNRRRRELARGNLIYRSMADELPDCLNVKDREGRFMAANPPTAALMRAGSAAALIGKTDFDFYPAELAKTFRADEEEVLATGIARRFDQPARFPDGSSGWLSTLKAPLRDEGGQVIGIITHNRDITEERRNQEIKNEFISTVSHELRTPLTSIRGSLGLIAAGVAGPLPPKAENLVRIAHSNSERLVLLINDILDMEKIESGKMSFDIKPLKLRPIVEQVIHASGNYRPEKGVRLLLVDDAPGATAEVDPDRLHQAFANLLSNAIKYSPDKGIVWVRISRMGGNVRLAVSDQGQGIPEAFRSRIFGKFEQADSSSTREKGGTGLGLSITKAIIEHMRGNISFETEEGQGTTFRVDLPEVAGTVRPAGGRPPVEDGRRRVLICEDEGDIAAVIAAMLAREGFASDVAPDLASAKTLLGERRYAALTLDIDLAGESGIQLFHDMRVSRTNADVPVVVISAMADEARRSLNGSAVGIVDWLEKPIDPERLHLAMQKILATDLNRRPRVLHVEDDEDVLEVMSTGLGKDVAMSFARSLAEAREQLSASAFDLVILDLALPDGSGLDLIADLPAGTPVIIFSAAEVDARLAASVKAVMTKTKMSEVDVAKFVRTLLADDAAQH